MSPAELGVVQVPLLDWRLMVGAAVMSLSAILAAAKWKAFKDKFEVKDGVGWLLAFSGFIVAYSSWYEAQRKDSLEKFYDRLDVSNRRLETLISLAAQEKNPHATYPGTSLSYFDMWVYVELDSLEYVLEKYRLRYMSEEHARRAIRTFLLRALNDQEFQNTALRFVSDPDTSYLPATVQAVTKLDKVLERRRAETGS